MSLISRASWCSGALFYLLSTDRCGVRAPYFRLSKWTTHGYHAGAAPFTLANNTEHICAQVRPLSATCGIHQIGGFRALGRRSLRWTPEQRRQQPKTTDYQHSLPRHDPGHRAGGAAPKGPPQAAIAMMMRSALADGFAATLPT